MANRARRLDKEWSRLTGIIVNLTASTTTIIGSLAFSRAQTAMRMIGEYAIGPSSAPAAGDAAVVTIGIGVVSTDAVTLGATAMPDPGDEFEFPWMYLGEHTFR